MFTATKDTLSNASVKKVTFMKSSLGRYIVASAWAGAFVGFGIFLIMVVGSISSGAGSPYTKIFMGLSFGIALSLVIMAGSELFTGNNMILVVGALDKKVTWLDALKIWIASYIGNFIGSFIIAGLFVLTSMQGSPVGDFVLKVAAGKMGGEFMPLLVKGILCNLLVCLAVLCSIRMKSESGKLIMIFWCLFAFITSGFEHSVANMTIFAMGLFMKHPETISIGGMFANLIPVTIGNFIGGGILLGGTYFYMGKK
ncbi:formate/nitrite transporter family protein [Helicovermis profundi]|uniref:Formate/nitrite transporter family protein n=1 Tax=Helicovermis profundi TaxID=3065157 RepID=A0AAU9E3S8_9FIRM|nr:formate/nitrite transporter family protein [Clostridia bacterium S502]